MNLFTHKLAESAKSILPIAAIVLLIGVSLVPMETGVFLMFLLGTVFLILGMTLFTMGAEMSMQQLGMRIGSHIAKTGHVWLIAFVSFIIGIIVTIAEPDLQILAGQIRGVNPWVLIVTVSVGVGVFLMIAMLRVVFGIPLSYILIGFYAVAFVMCLFVPDSLYSIAFDSGGVTTGPMTVPFLMALGTGVSATTSKGSRDDSFSIVSVCSIGPIISVLVLGIFTQIAPGEYNLGTSHIVTARDGVVEYARSFAGQLPEVLLALAPILVFAVLFQLITRAFNRDQLLRIGIGLLYTFFGLALFLTGANAGFLGVGYIIGTELAKVGSGLILLPVAVLLGYFIVKAEPAVYVLNKQIEHLSAGAISQKTVGIFLSVGVASALGLSVLRILTGLPIMYILIPGYAMALILTFFVPKMFVGIAFDSGGVASGAMMSAFVLPMAIGACMTLGADIMTQAFGCVALVAMTPIITIQICGLMFQIKVKKTKARFVSEQEEFLDYSRDYAPVREKEEIHG